MSNTYTTVQGDTWDSIAFNVLGSESYMTELIRLNEEYCLLTVLPSGLKLKIPDIKEDKKELNLPPWKRL